MTPPHSSTTVTVHTFTQRFSSTRRGARLARLLAAQQLADWGVTYGSGTHYALTLVVAELAANAVLHGRVPGRDFELRLAHHGALVRVEVSETHPALPERAALTPEGEGGRGLNLVAALAERWGVRGRVGPGKTVWAECALSPRGPEGEIAKT
ncbi:ATP-binding protein [Streptomyces sp. NBC_01546]|uniref:ATP-binding protein n=1 Tax=Streptomyces sp. NBC_01546 TaxID=2975872 RepID=UPI003869E26B